MQSIQLRDYQQKVLEEVERLWGQGVRSVMCQVPTGTGKSVVMTMLIKNWLQGHKGGVLVVSHRREINQQLYQTIYNLGLDSEYRFEGRRRSNMG